MAKRRRNEARDYPRTARLNELLREILAAAIDRIDDDRLGWVSVSGVDVDNELTKATVYLSSLDDDAHEAIEVLDEYKGQLRKAVGDNARLRKVPLLVFSSDPSIESGGRVEQILADLRKQGDLET